ncbi:MAG TPA: hypothetical protein VJ021_09755 [Thermoplasmata archaeon]|nr:hypothetical protein [Thermoplasmata archaeon]
MESTAKDENVTIAHEVAEIPAEIRTAIVDGVETVGHEVAKVLVEGAAVVIDATKAVVSDIAKAGEQLGQDTDQVVSPTPEPMKTAPPAAVAPVAVA